MLDLPFTIKNLSVNIMPNKEYLDFKSAIQTLLDNKKLILGGSLLVSILVAISSLFLDNYYYSQATFHVVNSMRVSNGGGNIYGDSKDVDRVISIAYSNTVKDYVINKHGLMAHYKIDTTKTNKRTRLIKEYAANISINNNDRGAIEVKVYDTDPELAAKIANDIVEKTNNQYVDNIQLVIREALEVQEVTMASLMQSINLHKDSLTIISQKYGVVIYNTEEESDFSRTAIKGWDNYLLGINIVNSLRSTLTTLSSNYSDVLNANIRTKQALSTKVSALIVLEEAIPADAKSKPIRSLIVIASFIISILLLIGYVTIKEYYSSKQND
jgi:uncharacterized protein involved in exopolysaccharide biosynthesis